MAITGKGDRARYRMKILLDMNLSPRWQTTLSTAGIESVHWSEVGDPCAPDTTLADYAVSNGLIVMTQDLNFGALLAASGDVGPSFVQIRAGDTSADAIELQVIAAIKQLSEELENGALVTVDAERSRVRMLPIRR